MSIDIPNTLIIIMVIAHFDLVGQEQADGLQALLSSEKETFSIIYIELTGHMINLMALMMMLMTKSMKIVSKTCPRSLPRRDSWPPGGSLRTQTASEGLCIARGCLLQRIAK